MNKTELVNAIAEQANISKLQAKAALEDRKSTRLNSSHR